jgi:D-xylose transport system permease protein
VSTGNVSTPPPQDDIALRDRDADRGLVGQYIAKLRGGDLGALPVIVGVIVVWAIFQSQNDNFLTSFNLTNLSLQITPVAIAAIGVVLVLLLGEIDLSVGSVSGLCAAIAVVMNLDHGLNGPTAVLLGVLAGAVIGLIQGLIITRLAVPSFVVTLAGLIGWQGVLLYVLGDGGTRNLTDPFMVDLTNKFFGPEVAWPIVIALIVVLFGNDIYQRRRRVAAGLTVGPFAGLMIRDAIISVVAVVATVVWLDDRGLPLAVLIMLALAIVFDLIVRRTPFGRHVFAVGGNKEAARRAGISVPMIMTVVFMLCSALAAFAGMMAASRGLAVNQQSGAGSFLLNAIAAAVIGGTSLFGGRGSIWSAVLGALVIGSVANGIALIGLTSDYEFMITALVLLAAVIVDATARRGRTNVR